MPELTRDLYRRVLEEYDVWPPKFELVLAEVISVFIDLIPESDEIHTGIPPERIARPFQAREGLHVRHRERGLRDIALGDERYASRAVPIGVEELP